MQTAEVFEVDFGDHPESIIYRRESDRAIYTVSFSRRDWMFHVRALSKVKTLASGRKKLIHLEQFDYRDSAFRFLDVLSKMEDAI